jgi:hypothetical protein
MQNREILRKKGHDGSQKMTCRKRGEKISSSEGGGGINIVFGPKYRPRSIYKINRFLVAYLRVGKEAHCTRQQLAR